MKEGEGDGANSTETWSILGHVGNQGCNEPCSFPHNSLKVCIDISLLCQIEYDISVKINKGVNICSILRLITDLRMISEI